MRARSAGLVVSTLVILAAVPGAATADSTCSDALFGTPVAIGARVAVPLSGRVQVLGSPNASHVPALGPALAGVGQTTAGARVAWRTTKGAVQVAPLVDSGDEHHDVEVGAPVVLSTTSAREGGDATADVSIAGDVVVWNATDGHHAVRLEPDGAPGAAVTIGSAGAHLRAVAGDARATWVVTGNSSGALEAQALPASGPPPAAVALPAGARGDVHLVADGDGGAYLLSQAFRGSRTARKLGVGVLHLGGNGTPRLSLIAADVQTDDPGNLTDAAAMAVRGGVASVAFGLTAAGGRSDVYLRTVGATGALGALQRLTRTSRVSEYATSLALPGSGAGGIVGLQLGAHVAGIGRFGSSGSAKISVLAPRRGWKRGDGSEATVVATDGPTYAFWRDTELGRLARRLGGPAADVIADEDCSEVT